MVCQDNAHTMQHRQALWLCCKAQQEQQIGLKRQKAADNCKHSFHSYYGAKEKCVGVTTGLFQNGHAPSVSMKHALIVPDGSIDTQPLLKAGQAELNQKRHIGKALLLDLKDWVEGKHGKAPCTTAEAEARKMG